MVVVGGGGGGIVYSLISPPSSILFSSGVCILDDHVGVDLKNRSLPIHPSGKLCLLVIFSRETKMFNHFILDLSPFGHFKRSAPVLIKT